MYLKALYVIQSGKEVTPMGNMNPTNSNKLSVHNLRVNELSSPMGIDERSLVFSWQISSSLRGARQLFYRVLIASDEARLQQNKADIWDSGKTAGNSQQVLYEGPHLKGHTRYWWKVMIWNGQDVQSESAIEIFDTGLFKEDWQAAWIWKAGAVQINDFAYFRKEISLRKPVALAKIFVSAHHYFQMYVNGARVSGYGSPAPSHPYKHKYYLAYDVTSLLQDELNCLSAIAHYLGGEGQNYIQALPGFILQMEIVYEDGSTETVVTDKSWETLDVIPHQIGTPYQQNRKLSAIEDYDGRKLHTDWMRAGFAEGVRSRAVVAGRIEAQQWPMKWQQIPEGIIERTIVLQPANRQETGRQVFDAGFVVTGWPRITIKGIPGVTIRMRYSEDLDEHGYVKHNVTNEESETYYDQYTMRGDETETWEPDFSYKAFRYVEVTGYPELLSAEQVVVVSAHTAVSHEGSFHSSSELLNKMYEACIQTQKNNTLGLLVDCPHREQAQFLADADLQAETLLYNFQGSYPVLEKVLSDFTDGQLENGTFPFVFPSSYTHPGFSGWIPEWDLHFCTILWKAYEWFNDPGLLQRYYEPAKRMLLFYLGSADARLGLIPKSQDPTDGHISDHPHANIDQSGDFLTVQNAKVAHTLDLMGRAAEILGYKADAECMNMRHEHLKKAMQTHLYDAKNKRYTDCYLSEQSHQGTQVVALQYGLVPPEDQGAVLDFIKSQGLDCRTLLSLNLLQVLFDHQAGAEAYSLLAKTDFPSWGYMIEQGSLTMWEGFQDIESHSHAWNAYPARMMVEYLVGIQMALPGWERVRIKPYIPAGIETMEGTVTTGRGSLYAKWEVVPDGLQMHVDIPANTTASVIIPIPEGIAEWKLEESGEELNSWEEVPGGIAVDIESGRYTFKVSFSE
ncbi:alpha-L-rhamnosidase [Paenibacillus eucommiae]|uniref:alpha-L-rhamnosidase n=1 Tax=Paenibacillus eucommiae TaxID=1355755 RepID=A0ABS4J3W9_9BACL|nr:alpha-L-rhamnosidase [Paenibacillus eucommiae]MBP1994535.1 alpha-L-rhamnosidase [Paenibacillus eucommiae]